MTAGRWFRRYGDTVRVGCNSTGRSWTLRCHDNQWIGEVGTCSGQFSIDGSSRKPSMSLMRYELPDVTYNPAYITARSEVPIIKQIFFKRVFKRSLFQRHLNSLAS